MLIGKECPYACTSDHQHFGREKLPLRNPNRQRLTLKARQIVVVLKRTVESTEVQQNGENCKEKEIQTLAKTNKSVKSFLTATFWAGKATVKKSKSSKTYFESTPRSCSSQKNC